MQIRHPETMVRRKDLRSDEIANLLRELSENELHVGELSSSNLDSNKGIRFSKSDCEESEETADVIDNTPVNPDTYVTRDGTECVPHNSTVPDIFATRNVLRESIGPTSFAKHNGNVRFFS
ncbi:uncharacterized protein TNCV_2339011 [Trichonephila clavipes]|nr:uncharacterized protein TNCV_2339011 [Trichonephila clavipes]